MKNLMLLVFCNAEKAFDRVQWDFMMTVLEKMQFGEVFRVCVQHLYSKQEAEIFMEGFTSEKISLNRGVSQGCPPPPLLFNLVIEVLAVKV